MRTITIHDIQRDPLGWLRRVEEGETLIVVRDDRPVAQIKPVLPLSGQTRPFGLCAGEFEVPADFDQPLPEELLKEFEGR
jgi:antitoxin (DNA-binding transcriptional repressor) of toxin-antitoxin stability system